MKIRESTRKVWTCSDGEEYMTRAEAEAHQSELRLAPQLELYLDVVGLEGRERTRRANIIEAWEAWKLAHSVRDAETEAGVATIGGAA